MIHSVRLINCQSWENGIIPLAQDRINVLRADNNSGKSVFFKMLKITACPGYFTPKEMGVTVPTYSTPSQMAVLGRVAFTQPE